MTIGFNLNLSYRDNLCIERFIPKMIPLNQNQIDKVPIIQAVMKAYLAAKLADSIKYGSYKFKNFVTGDIDPDERRSIGVNINSLPAKEIIEKQ